MRASVSCEGCAFNRYFSDGRGEPRLSHRRTTGITFAGSVLSHRLPRHRPRKHPVGPGQPDPELPGLSPYETRLADQPTRVKVVLIVAVKSYFDGSEIPSKSLTLAAVAADATTWTRFEASWENRKSMGNPPYVHMTDLMPYKGFTNPIGGIHWFSGLTNHQSLSPCWDSETANCESS